MRRCLVLCLALGFLLASFASSQADDKPKAGARILFLTYSGTFKHGSVSRKEGQLAPAEKAMTELGIRSNLFRVEATQDPAFALKKETLDNFDIVMFYTTGPRAKWSMVSDEQLEYFLNTWLKQKGHGFVGAHSAADTLGDYQPYWDMIGGTFNGHPWSSNEKVTITVHDQNHPLSKPWGSEFEITDEIYQFKNWQPEKVRVLMSLNMAKCRLKKEYHVPIAWVKEYGQGKCFHMSLGHREDVWENPKYQESIIGGIRWILGHESGDAKPNPELSSAENAKAKEVYEAAKAKGETGEKPPAKK
jgi:type 1 glutamine amidotransferase